MAALQAIVPWLQAVGNHLPALSPCPHQFLRGSNTMCRCAYDKVLSSALAHRKHSATGKRYFAHLFTPRQEGPRPSAGRGWRGCGCGMRSVGECVVSGGVQSTVYSRAQRASIESGQRPERGSRKEGAWQTAPLAEGGSPAQEPLTPSPRQAPGSRAPCLTGKRGPPGSQSRRRPQPPAPAQAASLPAPQAGPSQPRSLAGPPPRPL